MRRLIGLTGLLVVAVVLGLIVVPMASASYVPPTYIQGNQNCQDLGYDYGFKINSQVIGTDLEFTLTQGTQHGYPTELITGTPSDPNNSITIYRSDGVTFDWAATLGIDAVIVKAGPGGNLYEYDPEATADTRLVTPDNKDISHLEFCYDYELTATKTADAEFTRTYDWDITKSVDPASHTGWFGDMFSSDYDVFVDQTVTDSDWKVYGDITINNPTPFTVGFSVEDYVDGMLATVDCGGTTSLAPGGSVTCSYEATLNDAVDGTNTATITSLHASVGGAVATDDYAFGDPTVVGYETINVTDTLEGSLGSTSDDYTFEYDRPFECPTDASLYTDGVYEASFPNTATIVETGQEASANVDVTCYMPVVSKTADASYDLTWGWTIDKSADQTDLLLSDGQLFPVNYTVAVDATSTELNRLVYGTISVSNPSDENITVDITDMVGGVAATLDCGGTLDVPARQTATCDYSADPGSIDSGTNTSTVAFNGQTFPASDDYDFVLETETDECVNVTDTNLADPLGTVCAGDAPKTFNYSLYFGSNPNADVVLVCGPNTHTNIASFATDTGATGSDEWTVNVEVTCALGCTLTQGYWKTHSELGPAPYDDNWANLPNGASTVFYLSGQSWYEVFQTPPAGNAYYNLAHQFMAAKLNVLNGASVPAEVQDALTAAETLFDAYTPAQAAALKGKAANEFRALATILDNYNNGYIGPGHCDE